MKPTTSYGSLGLHDDDYDGLTENTTPSQISSAPESATYLKSMAVVTGLLLISAAAVSVSQFAGVSILPTTNKAAKLDSVNRPVYANLADYEKEALFRNFVDEFGKMYKTDEYQTKLETFKEYLELVDARNMAEAQNGGTALHGITFFADLTPTEMAVYFGYVASSSEATNMVTVDTVDAYTGGEDLVDWTDIYTTAVKDGGYCGSDWAFSAVQQIESDAIRQLGLPTTTTLSTQQMVSCDSGNGGCNGGDPIQGYEWTLEAGGLLVDDDYPYSSYTDSSGTCVSWLDDYYMAVSAYYSLAGTDSTVVEENMMNYVKSTGTLSVCIDASGWSSYVSGVVTVCTSTPNHCVQAVGVNTEESISSPSYWNLRNTWGTAWGESGYIRIEYGSNLCAITTNPTYTSTFIYGTTPVPSSMPTTPHPTFEPTLEPTFEPIFEETSHPTYEPTTEPEPEDTFEPTVPVDDAAPAPASDDAAPAPTDDAAPVEEEESSEEEQETTEEETTEEETTEEEVTEEETTEEESSSSSKGKKSSRKSKKSSKGKGKK